MKAYLLLFLFILSACGGGEGVSETAVSPTEPSSTTSAVETAVPTSAGTLYYVVLEPGAQNLARFQVDAEQEEILFEVPVNGWMANMDVSPDGSQIVMAYAPPPADNGIQFGYSNLYIMLSDGQSEPRELVPRASLEEILFNPVWSPDSETIYYSHVTPTDPETLAFDLTLERINYLTGESEVVAENGIWPRVSPDGRFLAYVHTDLNNLSNALMLMDLADMTTTELIPNTTFTAIDAPLFSPDGHMLYFSAVEQTESSRTWWEVLLGIDTAVAHSLPSDWWQISLDNPTPERLTNLNAIGLYADFSPNGQTIAFASQGGLYRMNPDGSDLQKWQEQSLMDSLAWRE